MSTPKKPESAFKKSVRAVEIGIALGVACFILNALVSGEIAGQMFQREDENLAVQALLLVLPAFILAPAVAFLAGLVIEGSRWRVVISQNITLQLTILLVPAVSMGVGEVFSAKLIALESGMLAAGVVLCALAMGRAQRRKSEPAQSQGSAASLASIDFEKVKQAGAVTPPVQVPAAPVAVPAAAPTTTSQAAQAAPADAAAPDSKPKT